MADPRFFRNSGPKTLGELAALAGVSLSSGADPAQAIKDVAPLDAAGPGDLSFLDNVKYKEQFAATKAGACIVAPDMADLAPRGLPLLLTKNPYKAYALAAQLFYPDETGEKTGGRRLENGAVLGAGAEIGTGTHIGANAVIGAGVVIGRNCRIGANAVISHSLIGDNVRIYPGCCIGQDGFGFAIDPAGHVKVPQLGRVIIENNVEIGANTTIDRGAGPDTVIGAGAWIDNLVQIGHNVKIGKGCIIVAQVGISGSTVIEDHAVLAGQVGVTGHLRIGKGARIAAQSGIMRDVPAGAEVMGSPAVPIRQHLRQVALLARMAMKGREDFMSEAPYIDINRVMELIPHRYPFLLVDRILEFVPGERAVGLKNVSMNEPQFQGHFPRFPVMPGVLIIESMAQTAGALVVHTLGKEAEGKLVYFMTIDEARFRKPVVPGDTMHIHVTKTQNRKNVWKFTGQAKVGDTLCAEAVFSAMILDS